MFGCTSDVSKKEQISQVIRYVRILNSKVYIQESFLGFILSHDQTDKGLANETLPQLLNDGLNIQDCRGQSYINWANMEGKYNGVQSRIID